MCVPILRVVDTCLQTGRYQRQYQHGTDLESVDDVPERQDLQHLSSWIDQFDHGTRAFRYLYTDVICTDHRTAFVTAHVLNNTNKIRSGINQCPSRSKSTAFITASFMVCNHVVHIHIGSSQIAFGDRVVM